MNTAHTAGGQSIVRGSSSKRRGSKSVERPAVLETIERPTSVVIISDDFKRRSDCAKRAEFLGR
jgi:hypothetical protein